MNGRHHNSKKRNSRKIDSTYCCGCGTCEAVCQSQAIKISENEQGFYIPRIDERLCVQCGQCYSVCPVHGEDCISNLPSSIVNYTAFYGKTTNQGILEKASSGGFVTELILYLIKERTSSKALLTKMPTFSLRPEVFLTCDAFEVKNAAGSKYCPVSLNRVLNKIDWARESLVYVGLPCHIVALNRYFKVKRISRRHFPTTVCLICNQCPSFKATDYLLWQMNSFAAQVKSIDYRFGNWPGEIKVKTLSGATKTKNLISAWGSGFGFYFQNRACLNCKIKYSTIADYIVGDPWFDKEKSLTGKTFILIKEEYKDYQITSTGTINLVKICDDELYLYKKSLFDPKRIGLINQWEKQLGYKRWHWYYIKFVSLFKTKYLRFKSVAYYYKKKFLR